MPANDEAGTKRSIAVSWIKNNIVSAIVSGIVSLLIFGVRSATAAVDTAEGPGSILILYLAVVVLSAFSGAAYGVLTGAVLQRIIPLLPATIWVALHVVMATAA